MRRRLDRYQDLKRCILRSPLAGIGQGHTITSRPALHAHVTFTGTPTFLFNPVLSLAWPLPCPGCIDKDHCCLSFQHGRSGESAEQYQKVPEVSIDLQQRGATGRAGVQGLQGPGGRGHTLQTAGIRDPRFLPLCPTRCVQDLAETNWGGGRGGGCR